MKTPRDFAQQLVDRWFVIERSESVTAKPLGRHIVGEAVVLVRTVDGAVLALEDRCPHQGVPLSHGRLGPKGLMCRYHGWSFDGRGQCTFIPGASGTDFEHINVQSYNTQEVDGQIWISRNPVAALPIDVAQTRIEERSIFLWEKKCLQSAAQLFANTSSGLTEEGSVAYIEIRAPLGCSARVMLAITPETLDTSRVFASARIHSRWLPKSLALRVIMPRLRRQAHPQALLGGDLRS